MINIDIEAIRNSILDKYFDLDNYIIWTQYVIQDRIKFKSVVKSFSDNEIKYIRKVLKSELFNRRYGCLVKKAKLNNFLNCD